MMMSLFSVFDPVSYLGVPINWMIIVMVMFMFPFFYYMVGSSMLIIFSMLLEKVGLMFKEISYPSFLGMVMLGLILFYFLSLLNLMGLFSYVFTASGHLVVTLSVGLMVWMMSFMMGWIKSFKVSSAHLVPEGAPLVLAPFMVVVEFLSHIIRPLTLSVRLAANMMAGHLIIGLISSMSFNSLSVLGISVFLQVMMILLESAVCFIQAFVFSVLVVLYSLDFY